MAAMQKSAPTSNTGDDTQVAAFWAAILVHQATARRLATGIVKRDDADDIVHSAALLFLDSLTRPTRPARFPASDDEFGRRFLTIVRNHAIDCIRDRRVNEPPVHTHWGTAKEPAPSGRKAGDRSLDQVFTRNDHGKFDAPAAIESRAQDNIDSLDQMLRCHLSDLPPMQRHIVFATFFENRKRADVSHRLGISVKTYDNHLQAAFRSLRHLLARDAELYTEVDRSHWYDMIEELRERYESARKSSRSRKGLSISTNDLSMRKPEGSRNECDVAPATNVGADAA